MLWMVYARRLKEQKSIAVGLNTSSKEWAHLWNSFLLYDLDEQPLNKNCGPWENFSLSGRQILALRGMLAVFQAPLQSSAVIAQLLPLIQFSLLTGRTISFSVTMVVANFFGSLTILESLGPMCMGTIWNEGWLAVSDEKGFLVSFLVTCGPGPPFLLPYSFFFSPYSLFMSSSPHWEILLRFLPHENFYLSNSSWIWQFNCEIGFSSLELSTRLSPNQSTLLDFASPQSTPVESKFH